MWNHTLYLLKPYLIPKEQASRVSEDSLQTLCHLLCLLDFYQTFFFSFWAPFLICTFLIDWALYLHQICWYLLSIIAVARAVWVIINAISNDRKPTPTSIPAKDCHSWLTCHVLSVHNINSFSLFKGFLEFSPLLHHPTSTSVAFIFSSAHNCIVVLCIFAWGARNESWHIMVLVPVKGILCMPTCLAGSCRGWSTEGKTFPKLL